MSAAKQDSPARPGAGSLRASSRAKSAVPAPDVHTFWPATDHPPVTAVARGLTLARADPAPRSGTNLHQPPPPPRGPGGGSAPRARGPGPWPGQQLTPALVAGEAPRGGPRPLLGGTVLEEPGRPHLGGDGDHLRGHAVARLLVGNDLVLPSGCARSAVLAWPRTTGEAGVEQPSLPPHGDGECLVLPTAVVLGRARAGQVGGGEVAGIALARGVGIQPCPHPGAEGLTCLGSHAVSPARLRGALRHRLPSSLVPRSSVQAAPRPSGSLTGGGRAQVSAMLSRSADRSGRG